MTAHSGPGTGALHALPPLRDVIRAHGLDARKALGQHFLLDGNVTARIARDARAFGGWPAGTAVVEIGPGPGGLTRALLTDDPMRQVIAIDADPRCEAVLAGLTQASGGRLHLRIADALTVDYQHLPHGAPYAIVANLPYNVGTPLLIGWLRTIYAHPGTILSLTLMFQKEVAERLLAPPGNKTYGRLSVLTQWLCEMRRGFDLPPAAFTPPPKVTSSVVHLRPRPSPPEGALGAAVPWQAMETVLAAAFNQRRKMLRSALAGLFGKAHVEALLHHAAIPPTARAETLSVEDFCRLAAVYAACGAP